jgi:RND family efflux transporter MFP subunit
MAVMKGLNPQLSVPIAVLAVSLIVAAYLIGSRPQARANPPTQVVVPVNVIIAKTETIRPILRLYGEVAPGREAEIRSMVAGRLIHLETSFRSGSYVTRGAELAVVDPFEYEIAEREQSADLTEAEAKLRELDSDFAAERRLLKLHDEQIDLRQRDRDRIANLAKKNQSSEKALDDAKLALNTVRQLRIQGDQTVNSLAARIEQQQAVVERHRAQLDRAKRDLSDTKIAAPFNGFLQDIDVANGKRVSVGESIGRLIAADDLEVRFEIPNADYSRLVGNSLQSLNIDRHPLQGRKIVVDWRLGANSFTYPAIIERVAAEIDSSTGGVELFARIEDGPSEILRPGAFVEVAVPDINYENVLVLPAAAVSRDGLLYVVEDNRLIAKQVESVREFADKVYVRGEIAPGTTIVAEQFPDIGPGVAVRPKR